MGVLATGSLPPPFTRGKMCPPNLLVPPSRRHVLWNSFAGVDGGPSGGSSMRGPSCEDPHRRQQMFHKLIIIIISFLVLPSVVPDGNCSCNWTEFSFIITPEQSTRPPPTHSVKISKPLSTAAGKLDLEDDLNYIFFSGDDLFFCKWKTTTILFYKRKMT